MSAFDQLYQFVVNNSPYGFAFHDIVFDTSGEPEDFVFIETNKTFEYFSGFNRTELIGNRASGIFNDNVPLWRDVYAQLLSSNGEWEAEYYNAETRNWFSVKAYRINQTRFMALYEDITAFKERTEELENFFQVNLDMLSIADTLGNFIKLNREWESTLGYSIQELETMNYLDLIHPDDLFETRKILAQLNQQLKVVNFVNRYRAKNGEYHSLEWRCFPTGSLVYSSCRDISDKLHNMEQIAYNEKLYRSLLESQDDIIARVDNNFQFTYVNDVYCRVFGVNKDELIGSNILKQVQESDRDKVMNPIKNLMVPPHKVKVVYLTPTAKGNRWFSWAFSAIFNEDRELIEILVVGRDITEIKLQEEKIESQERFRQIVDNIGGVFWLLSANKKELLLASSRYKQVFGLNPYDENPFELMKRVVYKDDAEYVDRAIAEFINTGNLSLEFRVVRPDNEVIWVSSSAFPVLDESGVVQRYAGLFQNITESKRAILSEEEKTNRLNAMIAAMPDTLFTLSVEGQYLDAYTSEPEKLLASTNKLIGSYLSDYFPADESEHMLALFRECIAEKKLITTTYTIDNQGLTLHYEARITPLDDKKVLSIVRDITEQVHTANKLRFQTRMQQLLVKISTTYINLPADQLDTTLNNSLKELGEFVCADRFYIFDYRKDDHAFYNTHEWCATDIEPQIEYLQGTPADDLQFWMDVHQRGEIMLIHNVNALSSDDPVRLLLEPQGIKSIVAVPIHDNGEYAGFVGIDSVRACKLFDSDEQQLLKVFAQTIMSVRQRIRSQRELEKALEKAKESDRLKSAFLATISHELRTPLNHILGFGSLIRDLSQEEHIREYASDIYTSGNSLLEMIEDVFDLALSEKSMVILRQSSLKGVELFTSAKNMLREILLNSGKIDKIKLEFNPESDLLRQCIITDRQKIQQVLTNLFNNAVKFTDSGTIEFGLYKVDNYIELYVKDTGIGIAPDNQNYLFDTFRQIDDGYNRRYEGLGIGLAIARNIAEVMGATLRVESSVGNGSCFYFRVPVQFV